MGMTHCPHCGASLPVVRDAFCSACLESLDEPPAQPRTASEQAAFRAEGNRQVWLGLVGVLVALKVLYWGLRWLGDYYHPR
jgi:hypothetical protein